LVQRIDDECPTRIGLLSAETAFVLKNGMDAYIVSSQRDKGELQSLGSLGVAEGSSGMSRTMS
jgi:hypothetical protein